MSHKRPYLLCLRRFTPKSKLLPERRLSLFMQSSGWIPNINSHASSLSFPQGAPPPPSATPWSCCRLSRHYHTLTPGAPSPTTSWTRRYTLANALTFKSSITRENVVWEKFCLQAELVEVSGSTRPSSRQWDANNLMSVQCTYRFLFHKKDPFSIFYFCVVEFCKWFCLSEPDKNLLR